MIYIHKQDELRDAAKRFPASHYVVVDDKLRILTAIKNIWGKWVTTVFVRQGHYALDPKIVAGCPPADVTIESIGELLKFERQDFLEFTATGTGAAPKRRKSIPRRA